MQKITLDEYKNELILFYVHEYDNNETKLLERNTILSKEYSDDFLIEVIVGTYCFIEKILLLSKSEYKGFIDIPLAQEPNIMNINLNLCGGWNSDTIVKDTAGNFYSLRLLRKTFGNFFIIEPCKIEYIDTWDLDGDFEIMSSIPVFSTYIQCEQKYIDVVRENFENNKIKKLEIN